MNQDNWLLNTYLPPDTNLYCFKLWEKYLFNVKVVNPRSTKLGDYRFKQKQNTHNITINSNLNSYEFLMVYLHEVAHCLTTIQRGFRGNPHGKHWQENMRQLIAPLLTADILPRELNQALQNYLVAPKASGCTHPQLTKSLRQFDPPSDLVPLEEVAVGANFYFRKRKFLRLQMRRTRITCLHIDSERTYLISKLALVKSSVDPGITIEPPF